jgi:serine/threonine protein kinase
MATDQWLGAELAGYRIDALIGHGGAGVVYRATHLRLRRPAAVKLLAPSLAADAEYRRRFEREARLAAALEHPHIVPVYDAGYAEDVLYLAMRYIDGPNLGTVLDEHGPMNLPLVCDLLTGVAEALDSAHHAGLVHRDVKPANIMITSPTQPGQSPRAYLCDFGIARHATSSSSLTTTGQFLGTLQYCAPEQIQGQPVDGRTDQYALACVAYHCLTGQTPYPTDEPSAVMFAHISADPPRPSAHNPALPPAIDDVIARALAKQPAHRYPDCSTFLAALTTAANTPAQAPLQNANPGDPTPATPHTVIWPPRNPHGPRSPTPGPTADRAPVGDSLARIGWPSNWPRRRIWWLASTVGTVILMLLAGFIVPTLLPPKRLATPLTYPVGGLDDLAATTDSNRVLICLYETLFLLDTSTGARRIVASRDAPPAAPPVTDDGYFYPQWTAYAPAAESTYVGDSEWMGTLNPASATLESIRPAKGPDLIDDPVISHDGRFLLYIQRSEADQWSLATFDTATSQARQVISLPTAPSSVTTFPTLAISPDGRVAYLAGVHEWSADQAIRAVDLQSGKTTPITVDSPYDPPAETRNYRADRLALSPDGKLLYAAYDDPSRNASHILVIETASHEIRDQYQVDEGVLNFIVSPSGDHLYLDKASPESKLNHVIEVLDASSGERVAWTEVKGIEGEPELGTSSDGRLLYVGGREVLGVVDVSDFH